MATYATRAIVIGRHNVGEADRILVLLTPQRGVIRGVAKGVRRIKSRLAGHLEPFCESDLMLAEGRNLDVITSARLRHHLDVGSDYDQMRLAFLAAEMINRLSGEDEHQEGLFDLLHQTYAALAASGATKALELWFKLCLLDRLGYRPSLEGCMICGTNDPDRAYLFNIELGGLVDVGCSSPGNPDMTQVQIKLWRLMLQRDFSDLRKIQVLEELAVTSLPICNTFYDYTFGKRFRSAEVLP